MKVSDTPLSAVEPYLLDGLDIFVGSEALLPDVPRAAGTVTGLGAVYPEVVAALVRDPSGPALERAAGLRPLLVKRFAASAKVALARRGLPVRPDVRAPLRPLDADERAALERALDAAGG
jgi:dihydrodipicolinate synthase/N-acetylneuraminate lyase